MYKCNGVTIFVLIYVDDIIITSSHQAAIPRLIADLQLSFAIKDLGPLHFFVGVEAIWTKDALHLSQQRYIHDLLTKTNMMLAKPISSPMSASSPLSKFDGSTIAYPSLYHSTVGSLQYLSITRPDLSFVVNKVSQFMQEPRDTHWIAVKRILRYLKFTSDHVFSIYRSSSHSLIAYLDSNWAGCPDDRRSTSAYYTFLERNLLSWNSKKLPTVSRSSTESEYKALANASAELVWFQALLYELGQHFQRPPILHCDNIRATYLSSNPMFHARTKHIAIDYHFVLDLVAAKELQIQFISGKDQIADILTKPLVSQKFLVLKSNLNVSMPTSSLRGRIGINKSQPTNCDEDNDK
jgi:hypothetical protein